MIMKHLEMAVEEVRSLGYTPVYAAIYGSQNYGLDTYSDDHQSDYDVQVIVMPSLYDLVFKGASVSRTVEYKGGQIDIKDVVTASTVILKMNPRYLEILLTPFYLTFPGGEYMEEVRSLLPSLLSQRAPLFARALFGCFQEKIGKAQSAAPKSAEKIRKYGYDGKELHHALRLKLMLEDFEKTGRMILHPPAHEIPYLVKLKNNEIPLEEVADLSRLWVDEATALAQRLFSGTITDEAYDYIMAISRQALYLALCCEASGIQSVQDAVAAKEVKTDE